MLKVILFGISTLLMLAGCNEQKQEAPKQAPALPVELRPLGQSVFLTPDWERGSPTRAPSRKTGHSADDA